MSVICLNAGPIGSAPGHAAFMAALADIAHALLPTPQSVDPALETTSDEVRVSVETVSPQQIECFVPKAIALSRSSGRSFRILVTLDESARKCQLEKYPEHVLGDDHLVTVRPTEEVALRDYFRYLFGAPS